MMHALYIFSLLVLFITGLNSTVTFISPVAGDIWTVGETQTISWTEVSTADNPNGDYLSVRLYQVFPNSTTTPDFEYLIQEAVPDTVNVNPAGWSVNLDTTKGLNSSVSNTYILALYLETEVTILAQSDEFTIQNTTAPSSPSSSAVSSYTSSSASSTRSGTSTTTSSAAATSTSAPAISKAAPGGLSAGAKAGIGIGVSAAVILGFAIGRYLFGGRKRQNAKAPTPVPSDFSAVVSQTPHMSNQSGVVPMTYAELSEESCWR